MTITPAHVTKQVRAAFLIQTELGDFYATQPAGHIGAAYLATPIKSLDDGSYNAPATTLFSGCQHIITLIDKMITVRAA